MWFRYYTIKGKRHYDIYSISYTLKQCKEWWAKQVAHLKSETREKWIKEATFERVEFTIKSLNKK